MRVPSIFPIAYCLVAEGVSALEGLVANMRKQTIQAFSMVILLSGISLAQRSTPASKGDCENSSPAVTLEEQVAIQQAEISCLRERLAELIGTHSSEAASMPEVAADSFVESSDNRKSTSRFDQLLAGAKLSGLMDVYFSYNAHQPLSGVNTLRLFDNQTNQFSLNLIDLEIVRAPREDARFGYNFTMGFGTAMNAVNGVDPGGRRFAQYLKEGYASYLSPLGNGLQVDLGKFAAPVGAEVMESQNNWNYSRGLLYSYAAPFYLFGVRAKYAFNDRYSLTSYLVNGWNNVVDVYSSGKTGGVTFEGHPTSKMAVSETWLVGRGASPADTGRRNFSSTVVQYSVTPKLTLMANADYGHSSRVTGFTHPVEWSGVAGYARYQWNRDYAFAARYEYYDDRDGFTTCGGCRFPTPQRVRELTTTVERQFLHRVITRLEFRHDQSDRPVFFRTGTPVRNQWTVTAGAMYSF